ncbi:hypothetical protein P280DRAFT_77042 [Massarina eburnea CBS 473.64]|uniref:Rhodopsin domain-containing protein n=1 Tax=Massarina eburnea CBS 473.64 TaxID=1395130 RepID=A0A6A6RUB4_9PLEO|nr:hypothetical protein P280DRAFT_77042 [Massarina eburnea CBS 473.64]
MSKLGLTVYSALMIVLIKHHGGTHIWNLTRKQAESIYYWFWIETIVYGPFIFFTKLSILLLYLRLLVPTRWSPLWTTILAFIALLTCFYIALTCVKIWQCDPISEAWRRNPGRRCINLPFLLQASGMFNTFSDVFILLVPIRACWNLKFSVRKKVAICAVFTIGAM